MVGTTRFCYPEDGRLQVASVRESGKGRTSAAGLEGKPVAAPGTG